MVGASFYVVLDAPEATQSGANREGGVSRVRARTGERGRS